MSPKVKFLFENDEPNWRQFARCRRYDPELWFADGTGKTDGYQKLVYATSICSGCPAQQECLDDAMRQEGSSAAEGRHGIRGGLTPAERYNLRRQATRKAAA